MIPESLAAVAGLSLTNPDDLFILS